MIVLVGGLPGSGKTYFATKLAERLNTEYISTDTLRKSLRSQGRYDIADKLFVYRELVKVAESKLTVSRNAVVVDATFSNRIMWEMFVHLANKVSAIIKFIWVYADEQLIKERTARMRQDSEADYSVYLKVRDEAESVDFPHLNLQSTNSNIETMLTKAIRYIFSDAPR